MTVYEMEGFLRGKCLPGDMKVNESNAQYLVRKLSELQSQNADMAVQLANAESKCRELAAENAALKELIEQHANSVAVCPNCSHEEPSETDDIVALYRSMETPATDAFLAEVRASGADEVSAICRGLANKDGCSVNMQCSYNLTAERAEAVAAQLRKGAAL
ncbi:hypothetical protein HV170_03505 [Citrobacter freundii]|uniref:hypothetical protein n=1 Tax=Citrobacter freundii TaxID=546 RepID=UPI0015F4640D|nr:hypothetical protein [Citrobacter freundii]